MKVRYDEEADALYIRLRKANYYESDEIKHGFILDYDAEGNAIGIEILEASLDFRSCHACTRYSLPHAYPFSPITHHLSVSFDCVDHR